MEKSTLNTTDENNQYVDCYCVTVPVFQVKICRAIVKESKTDYKMFPQILMENPDHQWISTKYKDTETCMCFKSGFATRLLIKMAAFTAFILSCALIWIWMDNVCDRHSEEDSDKPEPILEDVKVEPTEHQAANNNGKGKSQFLHFSNSE